MAKILLIDDDGIVRDALTVFLSRAGHEVAFAADGANGLLAYKNIRPDIVILDRDLPAMTGSAVFAEIKRLGNPAPVIILTGHDDPEDAEAYLREGASAFLSKADGLSNVLTEIERVMSARGMEGRPVKQERREKRADAPIVLVVDDDKAILSVLTRFLSSLGYAVLTAEDGEQASRIVEERRPDIALLDIFMPNKDGLTLLRELAASRPDTGYIMITGNDDEEVAKACLRAGAFDYLSKPVNLSALESVIRARLLLQRSMKPRS